MFTTARINGAVMLWLMGCAAAGSLQAQTQPLDPLREYPRLIENFAGWAEQHWNERAQSFDAAGSGVTWARGNGGVCFVYAVLLTERPERATFSPRQIPRAVMLDHVKQTLRSLCLTNKNCTDPRKARRSKWGGPTWQSALETEHWALAAHLLDQELDDDTRSLVRQVVTAEAEHSKKKIPSAKEGNTAADDCAWNAGLLGVAAAVYADDPRAASWDEWAKRWALNIDAREPDRTSDRLIDGKPLREWLVSINTFPDLTLENHDFWDLPYQTCFAAMVEPIVAYRVCGKQVPEAFYANAREHGEEILKWLVAADGDLVYGQGFDWAAIDVQHSWAFTELGTLLDLPWALEAEQRCLRLLARRQAAFGDGSLHANDFGYETDLATMWAFSHLLHKHFGKPFRRAEAELPLGSKVFTYVGAAIQRTPDLISSISWFRSRQAIMIVPNRAVALGDRPSFTSYRCNPEAGEVSGVGAVRLVGTPNGPAKDKKPAPTFRIEGQPEIQRDGGVLAVSFTRTLNQRAAQQIGYVGLPSGEVVVFSRWKALSDIQVAELVDHPFYWSEIPGFLPPRNVKSGPGGVTMIDGILQMQVLGGTGGQVVKSGFVGALRSGPFGAKAGEVLADSVCVYQAIVPERSPILAEGDPSRITLGAWRIERGADGRLTVRGALR